jgi:hypothetical protein
MCITVPKYDKYHSISIFQYLMARANAHIPEEKNTYLYIDYTESQYTNDTLQGLFCACKRERYFGDIIEWYLSYFGTVIHIDYSFCACACVCVSACAHEDVWILHFFIMPKRDKPGQLRNFWFTFITIIILCVIRGIWVPYSWAYDMIRRNKKHRFSV